MDADAFPREVLADEEPRYLRRQKPVEIKRRKFGRRAWSTYLRVFVWALGGLAGAYATYAAGHFLYFSPELALLHPDQVHVKNIQRVPLARVREIFAADRGRSVLRVPLDDRRRQIEAIPWVERAVVRRELPNTIEVEITERTPVAFLRQGSEMNLLDAHGVILTRPVQANFHFPVVTGLTPEMPIDDRERRMALFADFSRQVEAARPGAMDRVSEVNLADLNDLQATVTGLGESQPAGKETGQADPPVLVHFGEGGFEDKYRSLVENFPQWRAAVGRVESVDLRFSREAVVNPDVAAQPQPAPHQPAAKPAATPAAKPGPALISRPAPAPARKPAAKSAPARKPAAAKSTPKKSAAKKPAAKKPLTKREDAKKQEAKTQDAQQAR